jgi:hypothetical protein
VVANGRLFCGCGKRVGITRRAYNRTGGLIAAESERWREIRAQGAIDEGLVEGILYEGQRHFRDVQLVVHGGRPARGFAGQREITTWFMRATRERAKLG